jgi:D-3-phosphoglycerate dehydrogenase
MHVVAFDPVLSHERAQSLGVELVSLGELFERADAITAHTPLTPETTGMVDDAAIAKMKKGVLLVNCARGGVYDEGALLRGLESGKVGGVALDVFIQEPVPKDHPLLSRDDVIVTPHLGASTDEAQERVALEICEQIVQYLEHATITNAVNVPSVSREAAPRLGPYLVLARKLGALIAQVEGIHPAHIEVECVGEPAELGARAIMNSAVAGILGVFLEAPVNEVSAPALAADRGVVMKTTATKEGTGARRGAQNIVVVRAGAEGGRTLAAEGTLGTEDGPRLLRWGDYELNAELAGHAVVLFNEDKPGVIGAVGTLLGARGINVAQVHLGHSTATHQAVSMWTLDAPIAQDALSEIQRAPHVMRAVSVELK